MARARSVRIAVLLVASACTWLGEAKGADAPDPEDSLVVVISQTPTRIIMGNGFAVGNDSLVVTAYHLVFEMSEKGEHRMAGSVSVLSPYLGETREAEIIAADEELDIAVLGVPLQGHPSLALAKDADVISAEQFHMISMYDTIKSVELAKTGPPPIAAGIQSEDCPTDFVAVRKGVPRSISLGEPGKVGVGWSGGPMLLPGTSEVAGFFSTFTLEEDKPFRVQGPAAAQVRRLVNAAGRAKSLEPSDRASARSKDAAQAFLLCLRAVGASLDGRDKEAFDNAQAFIRLRPGCILGYRMAAMAAKEQGKGDQAESLYQKALAVDADSVGARSVYAHYLERSGRTQEALPLLDEVWKTGKDREWTALNYYAVLTGQGLLDRYEKITRDVLKDHPLNAHLWARLGSCKAMQKNYDTAAGFFRKAAALHPEMSRYRSILASMLGKAGKLDEAEEVLRGSVKMEAGDPGVHFMFAVFLSRHRPEAIQEAIEQAETALRLSPNDAPDRATIEKFIRDVRSRIREDQEKSPNTATEDDAPPTDR